MLGIVTKYVAPIVTSLDIRALAACEDQPIITSHNQEAEDTVPSVEGVDTKVEIVGHVLLKSFYFQRLLNLQKGSVLFAKGPLIMRNIVGQNRDKNDVWTNAKYERNLGISL